MPVSLVQCRNQHQLQLEAREFTGRDPPQLRAAVPRQSIELRRVEFIDAVVQDDGEGMKFRAVGRDILHFALLYRRGRDLDGGAATGSQGGRIACDEHNALSSRVDESVIFRDERGRHNNPTAERLSASTRP